MFLWFDENVTLLTMELPLINFVTGSKHKSHIRIYMYIINDVKRQMVHEILNCDVKNDVPILGHNTETSSTDLGSRRTWYHQIRKFKSSQVEPLVLSACLFKDFSCLVPELSNKLGNEVAVAATGALVYT